MNAARTMTTPNVAEDIGAWTMRRVAPAVAVWPVVALAFSGLFISILALLAGVDVGSAMGAL